MAIGNCNGDGRWCQAQRWGATALYTGLTTEGPPRPGPPLCVTGGGASFLTQTFYLKVVTDSDADFPLKFSLPALRRHIGSPQTIFTIILAAGFYLKQSSPLLNDNGQFDKSFRSQE